MTLIAAGLATGTAAAIFGYVDYLTIPMTRRAKGIAKAHLVTSLVTLALYAVAALLRSGDDGSPAGIAVSCAGALALLAGGYYGSELAHRYRVGISDAPTSQSASDAGRWRRARFPGSPRWSPSSSICWPIRITASSATSCTSSSAVSSALGYVDQPPVVPLLAAPRSSSVTRCFGCEPCRRIFAAGGVFVTTASGARVRRRCVCAILAALDSLRFRLLVSFGMKASPDEMGLLTWPLDRALLLRIVRGRRRPSGGSQTGARWAQPRKQVHGLFFFAIALLAGLRDRPQRRILRSPWSWGAPAWPS